MVKDYERIMKRRRAWIKHVKELRDKHYSGTLTKETNLEREATPTKETNLESEDTPNFGDDRGKYCPLCGAHHYEWGEGKTSILRAFLWLLRDIMKF